MAGFLKSAGLASISDATVVKDDKKGDYYVAKIEKPGRAAAEIIAETVVEVRQSSRGRSRCAGDGQFQWVRPLQAMMCLLDGKVGRVEIAAIQAATRRAAIASSGPHVQGQRFSRITRRSSKSIM